MALSYDEARRLGQADASQRFAPRMVSVEQVVAEQLHMIAYLRSNGQDWAEAVYNLRDLVVGLEDDEFWDGIPEAERADLPEMPPKERDKLVAKRAREGWNGYPVRAFRGPNGPIYQPTPENLSHALRIIMRLLARRGIAWRHRNVSRLTEWEEPDGEG